MKLNLYIHYPINLYNFVENSSGWHPFTQKVKIKFNEKQKKLLYIYSKIRKKYRDCKWFEDSFTKNNLNESLKTLSKKIKSRDILILRGIFYSFDKLYRRLWKIERQKLKKIKCTIEDAWKEFDKNNIRKIADVMDVNIFKKINVYLSYSKNAPRGSLFGTSGILLEVTDLENPRFFICIIIHEIVHFLDWFQGKNSYEMILKRRKIGKKKAIIIHEALVQTISSHFLKNYFDFELEGKTKWERDILRIKKKIKPLFNKFLCEKENLKLNFWKDFLPLVFKSLKV